MPNVNIPESEKTKLVWTHQEKRRRQLLNMHMVVPGKRIRRRRPRRRWLDNTREDMKQYEMTAIMTGNRQYWKVTVKTGPDVKMVSKGERETSEENTIAEQQYNTLTLQLAVVSRSRLLRGQCVQLARHMSSQNIHQTC